VTRVVADTNVYGSALLFGGVPGTFLDLALAGSFSIENRSDPCHLVGH